MSLVINSNLAALNSQRQLVRSNQQLDVSMERLASGRRINSAADDAAGLVLSNRMTSQIRGLDQAVRNANDGISLIQVAEGAMDETTSILQRIRELSVQSANGIYSDTDRATLDAEVTQLVSELDRIAETTSFNGQKVLDGDLRDLSIQVGANANEVISFDIPAMDANSLGMGSSRAGDSIGADLNLSTNGTLAQALTAGAVKVNGQTLGPLSDGATVQSLLDELNSLQDIEASTQLSLTADLQGDGVLAGSDSVVISAVELDGSSFSITVAQTTGLEDLADSIASKSGGRLQASVNDEGRLVIASDSFARVSVADSTGGTATGYDVSTIADPDIAATINGLNNYWISEAETLISTFFGITGDGVDLTLNLDDSDGAGGTLASVSWVGAGLDVHLNIDMADFTDDNQPNGGSAPFYNDRVIAHEMVHAVMTRITDMSTLPGWFTEGAAELIHGADERVVGDFASLDAGDGSELAAAFKTTPGSPTTSAGYSAAYLATKFLHDDSLNNGGGGMTAIFDRLELGDTLDQALGHTSVTNGGATAWNDLATFEAHFLANGVDYLNGAYAGGTLNLGDTDTGSIAGSDYGNPIETAESILDNTANAGAINFNLVIPDEYAGTAKVGVAQLVLQSEDGVLITQGANGTDMDIENLGFREMEALGEVVTDELSNSEQSAALAQGDLVINGVAVGAVAQDQGLMSKVEAINAISDETGVEASIEAGRSFALSSEPSREFVSSGPLNIVNAGVFGFRGLGVQVDVGDTATDIAAKLNAITAYNGVTAYADDNGLLHAFTSGSVLTPGYSGGALAAEIGLVDSGAGGTGSLEINGVEVNLSDLSNLGTTVDDINLAQGATGVWAKVDDNGELELGSSAGIRLALGDTNGLMTLHALGISFSTDAGGVGGGPVGDLGDSDGDKLLEDESFILGPRIRLNSDNDTAIELQVNASGEDATGFKSLNAGSGILGGSSLSSLSVATQQQAQDAISVVDTALETINGARSELGAVNNRLAFTVSNLMNISENSAAARSRIIDADFAAETASLSRAQVLSQAAQAMLVQANSQPQQVLQLLRG